MVRIIARLLLAMTLVALSLLPGMLHPAAAGAASDDVLDQSQTTTNNYVAISNLWGTLHQMGQTFTAGVHGNLDRVSVRLENDATYPATGSITVSIQTVTDQGLPSGRAIGRGEIPICANAPPIACPSDEVWPAGSPRWVDVSISEPGGVILTPGTQYAIVLSLHGNGAVRWHDYFTTGGSIYAGGQQVYSDSTGWHSLSGFDSGYDAGFKTYVIPPALDQSQTASNRFEYVGYGDMAAQIFTPSLSGVLARLSVYISDFQWASTSPITVTIQTLTGVYPSVPTGTVLGSGTIPASAVPPKASPAWVDVSISGETRVTAGTAYAIVPNNGSKDAPVVEWYDYDGDVYTRGYFVPYSGWYQRWTYGELGNFGSFSEPIGPRDLMFKTYVIPVTPVAGLPGPPSAHPYVSHQPGGGLSAGFDVSFASTNAGEGRVSFGPGPGCTGLIGTATQDAGAGTITHLVHVTGDDMNLGSGAILPGATYSYKVLTVTRQGIETQDNGGTCYTVTIPSS